MLGTLLIAFWRSPVVFGVGNIGLGVHVHLLGNGVSGLIGEVGSTPSNDMFGMLFVLMLLSKRSLLPSANGLSGMLPGSGEESASAV